MEDGGGTSLQWGPVDGRLRHRMSSGPLESAMHSTPERNERSRCDGPGGGRCSKALGKARELTSVTVPIL